MDFNHIKENNAFREHKWIFSHLKTFKYKVYNKINHDDLKKNSIYLKSATDLALMYPMLEMSNGNFKCIQNILYKYNKDHPESNHNDYIKLKKQKQNALFVQNLQKYNPIF